MQEHTRALAIDPITLEVIRHGLVSITNQIDANIKRTAFSPYIYEYNDFAVGLTDDQETASLWGRLKDGDVPDWLLPAPELDGHPFAVYRVLP
jgi:hypothetical protein